MTTPSNLQNELINQININQTITNEVILRREIHIQQTFGPISPNNRFHEYLQSHQMTAERYFELLRL